MLHGVFAHGEFLPHGVCLLWNQWLVLTRVVADSVIALAYYSIPVALIYFISQTEGPGLSVDVLVVRRVHLPVWHDPCVGWSGVFKVAIVFDVMAAVLAFFVLRKMQAPVLKTAAIATAVAAA